MKAIFLLKYNNKNLPLSTFCPFQLYEKLYFFQWRRKKNLRFWTMGIGLNNAAKVSFEVVVSVWTIGASMSTHTEVRVSAYTVHNSSIRDGRLWLNYTLSSSPFIYILIFEKDRSGRHVPHLIVWSRRVSCKYWWVTWTRHADGSLGLIIIILNYIWYTIKR